MLCKKRLSSYLCQQSEIPSLQQLTVDRISHSTVGRGSLWLDGDVGEVVGPFTPKGTLIGPLAWVVASQSGPAEDEGCSKAVHQGRGGDGMSLGVAGLDRCDVGHTSWGPGFLSDDCLCMGWGNDC